MSAMGVSDAQFCELWKGNLRKVREAVRGKGFPRAAPVPHAPETGHPHFAATV